MPVNKKAQIRYQILDSLLRSRTGYSIMALTDKVNEKLIEFQSENGKRTIITDRTIRNDIKNMQEIYAVEIIKRGEKFLYEDADDSIDNINLKPEDKTAIHLAMGVFQRFHGTDLYEKFSGAITRVLASSVLRSINTKDTKKYIHVSEAAERSGIEWIEIIYDAIIEKKALVMHYTNFGGKHEDKIISPYILKESQNKWYMLAHWHERPTENILMFKLGRIQKLEEANEAYFECTQFNPEHYFKYTLGVFQSQNDPIEVRLLLRTKNVIKLLSEDKVHPSQTNHPINDNEMEIRFTVYDTHELNSAILRWGDEVEVLAPDFLRERIANHAANMHLFYNAPG